MNRILVPLDGSEFSAQILEIARKFFAPDACAFVLYTVGAPVDGYMGLPPRPDSTGLSMPMYESSYSLELSQPPIYGSPEQAGLVRALTDQLDALAKPLREAGYTVTVEADIGVPAEAIIERARASDIQLIALTTHGRSGISRLLMGSVAEQVIRHAPVPVVVARPAPKPEENSTKA